MDDPQPTPIERERSIAEIIGEALDMYQGHPLLFLTLALGVIAPYELAALAATGSGPLASAAHQNLGVFYLLVLLNWALVGPLVSALHIHAVALIGDGARPRLAAVAVRGLRVLPVVAAAAIASGIGIALGFLALIIPGILLWLRWSVVAQVAAVEHDGWIPSLRRSQELTRGHYGHIFGLLLITVLLTGGISFGAQLISLGSTEGPASVALGIASKTITTSFTALTLALLYYDLCARIRGARSQPAAAERQAPDPE
jgi:hypothetical protein